MSRSCQSRSCCLLDVLEIVIDSVMDPTFHVTASHTTHTVASWTLSCCARAFAQHKKQMTWMPWFSHSATRPRFGFDGFAQKMNGRHATPAGITHAVGAPNANHSCNSINTTNSIDRSWLSATSSLPIHHVDTIRRSSSDSRQKLQLQCIVHRARSASLRGARDVMWNDESKLTQLNFGTKWQANICVCMFALLAVSLQT